MEGLHYLSTTTAIGCIRLLLAGVSFAGWTTYRQFHLICGLFNHHKGCLFLHRGLPINAAIRKEMHFISIIPVNDANGEYSDSENFSSRVGIKSGTSTTRGQCNNDCAITPTLLKRDLILPGRNLFHQTDLSDNQE